MALHDPAPPSPFAAAVAAALACPATAAAALQVQPQHAQNLARLAVYLRQLPDDYAGFTMYTYSSEFGQAAAVTQPECGAVACAVGHGPAAGIAPLQDEEWGDYCDRCFTSAAPEWTGPVPETVEEFRQHDLHMAACHAHPGSVLWSALFDSGWTGVDNTPRGAAARIAYCLANGLPGATELRSAGRRKEATALYAAYLD